MVGRAGTPGVHDGGADGGAEGPGRRWRLRYAGCQDGGADGGAQQVRQRRLSIPAADVRAATRAGRGVLETRLTNLSRQDFAHDVWGRAPCSPARPRRFTDCSPPTRSMSLVSRRGLRPFLRAWPKERAPRCRSIDSPRPAAWAPRSRTSSTTPRCGAALPTAPRWSSGAAAHLGAVADFSSRLGVELGHGAGQCLRHRRRAEGSTTTTTCDVFVTCRSRELKRWIIHEPVHPRRCGTSPGPTVAPDVAEAAEREAHLGAVLTARGRPLSAARLVAPPRPQGAVSDPPDAGVHNWTRHALAEQLAQSALQLLRDDPRCADPFPGS